MQNRNMITSRQFLDELYGRYNSIDLALQTYAGYLGVFNMYYGHKVCRKQKKKFSEAKRYLVNKFSNK